jgi:inner membrane protein
MDIITWLFLLVGAGLLVSEFMTLSLAAGFFGVSGLLVAALRAAGLVESLPLSLMLWAVGAAALLVPLRPLLARSVGLGERRRDRTDLERDTDAMGEIVDVMEDVAEDHDNGRIWFQGTSWQARSTSGVLRKGERAQLVLRDKTVWVIEAVEKPTNAVPEAVELDEVKTAESPTRRR